MKLVIQLTQDNGTVVRAVSRDVPQVQTDRIVEALRKDFIYFDRADPTVLATMSAQDLFQMWAEEVFAALRARITEVEMRETAKPTPVF